jgi:hypothetical protein
VHEDTEHLYFSFSPIYRQQGNGIPLSASRRNVPQSSAVDICIRVKHGIIFLSTSTAVHVTLLPATYLFVFPLQRSILFNFGTTVSSVSCAFSLINIPFNFPIFLRSGVPSALLFRKGDILDLPFPRIHLSQMPHLSPQA